MAPGVPPGGAAGFRPELAARRARGLALTLGDRPADRPTVGGRRAGQPYRHPTRRAVAAVLTGLAVIAVWPGGWSVDPVIALAIAAWSIWEGAQSWQGADCC